MFTLFPQKSVIFELFEKSVWNVHEGAKALKDLFENYTDLPSKVQKIKDLEHDGDDVTHHILEHLAKTFITPLDRDDINHIAQRLDDVLDQVDMAANRMILFDIPQPTEEAKEFSRILFKSTALLIEAISKLRNLKNSHTILECCLEIHTQENEADRLMQQAIGRLFDEATDAKEIIKWKDIYQILESATDRCEDVADVLHTIIVKHA
jgi:predicted phosphate transport protein (TIGR00153 family)